MPDGSIVQCDACRERGRRRAGCACPDFWFFIESTNRTPGVPDGSVYIVYACSEACRDGLWRGGPGPGIIDEDGSMRERARIAKGARS